MFAVFLASAAALAYLRWRENWSDPLAPEPRVQGLVVPDFEFRTQDGGTITRSDLLGRTTIVDFIFTHCPLICPTLTQEMLKLSAALRGSQVRFLSVSVDPVNDTPQRLREYASANGIDTTRWTLATGTEAMILRVAREGLKFEVSPDPKLPIALPGGGTMNNIVHPSWFVLIGPDGRVLEIYQPTDPAAMARLAERAAAVDRAARR